MNLMQPRTLFQAFKRGWKTLLFVHLAGAIIAGTLITPLAASIIQGTNLVGIVPSRLAERMSKTSNVIGVEAPFGHIEIFETLWWHASHNTDPAHVWLRKILCGDNSPAI